MDRRAAILGLVCSAFPGVVSMHAREYDWTTRLAGVFGVRLSNERLMGNDRAAKIITLTVRIVGPLSMNSPDAMTELELKRHLRTRIAESFANGRVRQVNGWWLADVEADALEFLECLRA